MSGRPDTSLKTFFAYYFLCRIYTFYYTSGSIRTGLKHYEPKWRGTIKSLFNKSVESP